MSSSNREYGERGERIALKYLEKLGYRLLERNYRALRAEIDIIMLDSDTIVFVEVKARHKSAYGLGREAVTYTKRAHIISAAKHYIHVNGKYGVNARFDVVEVDLDNDGVTHIINAFSE